MTNAPKQPSEPALATCTTREAARILGVSLRAVQLWTERGLLDAWKTPGGHRRILTESVERFLALRRSRSEAGSGSTRRYRVLIVESDPAARQRYETELGYAQSDMDISYASDGYLGLICFGEQKPDLIIADLLAQGLDGPRIVQALRLAAGDRPLAIVVVTTQAGSAVANALPQDIPVLTKPLDFDRIRTLIDAARGNLHKR